MKLKIENFLFLIAFIIKLLLSLIVSVKLVFVIINLSFILLYSFMLYKKYTIYSYIPLIMIDFIAQFYLCISSYGYSFTSIVISLVFFVFSSGFLYYLFISYVTKLSCSKIVKANVDKEIDTGIKALENENYDLAIESFSKAIKEGKKNYLGYMGMCNTLTKMDKKNIKQIAYYKKRCLKYAPKELKESINDKY